MAVVVTVKAPKMLEEDDINAFMENIARKAADEWRSRLFQIQAISSGELLSSISDWHTEKEAVVVGAFYGKFIDTGTAPFWPPYLPIWEWALWKTRDPEEAKDLAKAVQKKIAEKGITPRHISDYVVDEMEKELGEIIEKKLLR